jgi:glycosyltransferase involved in cell wall biosynthesis
MKILILVPQLPQSLDKIKGGAHSAVINLMHGFSHFKVNVLVVSFTKEVISSSIFNFKHNIDIVYENEGPFHHHSLNYLFFGNSIIKKYIKKFNPDIIHYQAGNSFLLTLISRIANINNVLTIHGMASEEAKRKIKITDRIKWNFNNSIQKIFFPQNIIHLSKFSLNIFNNKRIVRNEIIPNALEESYFDIPMKNKTDNILLYIGVIDNNKNIINLLRAIKSLKENNIIYKLEVLGDFNNEFYKNYIISYVKFNGLTENVYFNGWINTEKVKEYLYKADILVVSSFHESLPMVIAEAMAAGKVVVASSVGGIPEMINDGVDGFLYDLKNPNELYEILEILYDNNTMNKIISKQAKISALNKYNAVNVAKRTIEFYNKCLTK